MKTWGILSIFIIIGLFAYCSSLVSKNDACKSELLNLETSSSLLYATVGDAKIDMDYNDNAHAYKVLSNIVDDYKEYSGSSFFPKDCPGNENMGN